MNTQERDQLNQLLKQLVDFKLTAKDSEAESLIHEAVTRQPDAAYLLVQRVMLLEHGLNNAKVRIEDLEKQLQNRAAGQSTGSFLGSDPWAQPGVNAAPAPAGAANYQQPRYAQQPQYQPQAAPAQSGGGIFGGGSSFLGNVATTAAGVVAGSFLFQGIENLMGHHGGGYGGGFGQSGFGGQPYGEQIGEQTVINNYYGDDSSQLADNSDYYNTADYSGDDADFQDDSGGDSDWI
jgi:uncharacterized protein